MVYDYTDELTNQDMLDICSIKEFAGQKKMAIRRNYVDTERG